MTNQSTIKRRTFLRGLGTAIALPVLDSLRPAGTALGASVQATERPVRLAYLYVPNGIIMDDWKPEGTGTEFKLPPILAPLEQYRKDLLVVSGLAQDNAYAHGDGGGDHARGASVFLTGVHPVKTAGKDMRVGTSVDQIAAQHLGGDTRFRSLELGCESGRLAGSCDSGYSCAYSNTISWKSPTQPLEKETNPALVFDRLFGGGPAAEQQMSKQRRQHARQSILDFVANDARRLRGRLDAGDRRKVEQYLDGIREVERRLDDPELAENDTGEMRRPDGPPEDFGKRIRLMGDMMVLAFASDATRIATLMVANEGSNRAYRELEQSEGHHGMSHHNNKQELIEKLAKINHYHVQQLAYIVGRLSETDDNGQRLIDNTLLLYGSGISDGNRHSHNDLPIVVAGGGGGLVTTGRHIEYPRDTPLTNFFVSTMQGLGAPVDSIGDSTGPLPGLTV